MVLTRVIRKAILKNEAMSSFFRQVKKDSFKTDVGLFCAHYMLQIKVCPSSNFAYLPSIIF